MIFVRLIVARVLLALAGLADGALVLLEPTVLRTMLARLALRGARLFAGAAERIAPWIIADYVAPPERRPSTWALAVALARGRLARWRLDLRRRILG